MKKTPAIILGAAVLTLGIAFSPNVARAFDATQPAGAATTAQTAPLAPGAQRAPHGFAALNLSDAQKAQFKSIQDATQAKITAILTPDQQTQLTAALAANPAPAANAPAPGANASAPGAKRHGHGNRFMRALRSLNLSDQQRQQIRTIQTDQRAQMMAVLTPDQQAKLKSTMSNRAPAGAK